MSRTWQSDPVDLQNRLCNQITQLRAEVERLRRPGAQAMSELTGEQRYRQIRVKKRILAERAMRDFLAGKIAVLPCSMDVQDELICREFDRMQQELRAALEPKP